MRIDGQPYRTIWRADAGWRRRGDRPDAAAVRVRDADAARASQTPPRAIRDMVVRGAPLIGVTAAYGVALALRAAIPAMRTSTRAIDALAATRPTAVNLRWALAAHAQRAGRLAAGERARARRTRKPPRIADEDVAACAAIGRHGLALLRALAARKPGRPLNVLTHCNAGWLACVDWGTALAPIYAAHDAGLPLHVWVDETRPRNQGAFLTALELGAHGVPHTVIADNAGGHLMQHGEVDVCIVGSDRTTASGDVANKIGTYLKALAAHDNGVPFYAALPSSTIDWSLRGRRARDADRGAGRARGDARAWPRPRQGEVRRGRGGRARQPARTTPAST